jgi:hypothetical protein
MNEAVVGKLHYEQNGRTVALALNGDIQDEKLND